jgi:hypothetical protein
MLFLGYSIISNIFPKIQKSQKKTIQRLHFSFPQSFFSQKPQNPQNSLICKTTYSVFGIERAYAAFFGSEPKIFIINHSNDPIRIVA